MVNILTKDKKKYIYKKVLREVICAAPLRTDCVNCFNRWAGEQSNVKVRFAPKKERTSGKVIVKVRGYWSVVEIPHASIQQYIK